MELKLSIIVPVYNVEQYLSKCVESLLHQDLSPEEYEIILVEDRSPDRCGDICEEFASNYSNIKVIHRENGGLSAARNSGISVARGRYVQFVDSDDYLEPEVLKTLVVKMENEDLDVLRFNYQNVNEKYEVFDPNKAGKVCVDYRDEVCEGVDFLNNRLGPACYVCQFVLRRELVLDCLFKEGIYFEDMPFFFYVYLKAERISIIRKHFYYRRKHNSSITHVVDASYLDTIPAGCELMKRFIENGFYEDYKFDLIAYKINGPRMALLDIVEDSKEPLFNLIKEDYEKIKKTEYYQDYLDNLGPKKKKFFLDVLKYDNYQEFKKENPEY